MSNHHPLWVFNLIRADFEWVDCFFFKITPTKKQILKPFDHEAGEKVPHFKYPNQPLSRLFDINARPDFEKLV